MARRVKRTLGICTVTFALAVGLAPAQSYAEPDAVTKAQKELDRLEDEASAADARYTELADQLAKASTTVTQASANLDAKQKQVRTMAAQLGQIALAGYQTQGINMTAQLLASSDDSDFLGRLATVESVQGRTNDRIQDFQVAQAELAAVKKQVTEARESIQKASVEQKSVAEKYKKLEDEQRAVVDRLSSQERSRLEAQQAQAVAARTADIVNQSGASSTSRSITRTPGADDTTPVPASGRASIAIAYAMSKVGGPYVWGGTGPVGYDCSGLMMMAWRAAGVSLPRVASAQFGVGQPVSLAELQPGDLVFYRGASPQHVAMYIGGGKIVHAASTRSGIKVAPVGAMTPVGARRVG